jgi:hypothetical protein
MDRKKKSGIFLIFWRARILKEWRKGERLRQKRKARPLCPFPLRFSAPKSRPAMLTLPAAPRLISPYCDLISLPLLHLLFLWWANLLIPQLTSFSPWRGEAEGVD